MRRNAAGGVGWGEISPSEDSGVEPRKLLLCVHRVSVVQAYRTEDRSDGMGVYGELRPPKRDAHWGREPLRSAALQIGGWLRLVHADWEIGAAGREASRECCEVVSGVNLTRTGSDSKSRPPSPRPSPRGRGRSICRVLTHSVAGCAWSTGPLILNSEVELAGRAAARGAHAAGVPFSAARRKPRATNFFGRRRKLERGHEGLGGPPNPARGPRALPISISEFGINGPALHAQPATD